MPKKRQIDQWTPGAIEKEITAVAVAAATVGRTLQSYLDIDDPTRQKWNLLTHEIEKLRLAIPNEV